MNSQTLQKLKHSALEAQRATGLPWWSEKDISRALAVPDDPWDKDYAFIAQCDPLTVVRMVSTIEAYEAASTNADRQTVAEVVSVIEANNALAAATKMPRWKTALIDLIKKL